MIKLFKKVLIVFSPILFIALILISLDTFFLIHFHTIKNTIGYDSPAHLATIQIISDYISPSFWGWTQQWYAGMPLPLFYPPLPYYIASIFTSFDPDQFVLRYKYISEFFILLNICTVFIILKIIFKDALYDHQNYIHSKYQNEVFVFKHIRVHLPILLSIIVVFYLNTGAPGMDGLSHGLFSHQFSMVWFFISVFGFWLNTKKSLLVSSVSTGILILSNAHTFLTLCLLLPFLILFRKHKKPVLKTLSVTVLVNILYFSIGLTIAAFWLLPMISFYDYFTGIYKVDTWLNNRFLLHCFPILLLLIPALLLSIKQKSQLFYLYTSIISGYLILFVVDILQRYAVETIPLPIQLWRWYETLFVLLTIPLAHILFYCVSKYKYIGSCILLSLFIFSVTEQPIFGNMYFGYFPENVPQLKKYVQQYPIHGLTYVYGNERTQTTFRQMTLDAELGSVGQHTIFTNIRESSLNSIFLRQAKRMVSGEEENWALINFIQPQRSPVHIDSRYDLLHFLGVNRIILGNNDIENRPNDLFFSSSTHYNVAHPSDTAFTILQSKTPQSRATQIQAPLTLIFAENGFRDRKISDPTYTRFQETSFEKKLYTRSITFNPHTPVIEENVDEINKAKYIVLATLETKDIRAALDTIEHSLIHPNRKVFILANKKYSAEYQLFWERFMRHKQVIFINPRSISFPFDEIVSHIIASEPFDYLEKPLSVEMNNTTVYISNPHVEGYTNSYLTQTIWFIRQSYFPAWIARAQDGTVLPTYLASPGYTLVFPEKNTSVSLYFSTPRIVIIGHIVSLLGLLSILVISIHMYKKTSKDANTT